MNFYIIRHGETDWNLVRKMQGQSDVPLNATGLQQAQGLVDRLEELQVTQLFSSPLMRAQKTAEIANRKICVPLSIHPELTELDCGEAEGLTKDEIIEKWGAEAFAKFEFPNSEPKEKALHRYSNFILQQLQKFSAIGPNHVPAFVTHGFVTRTFLLNHFPTQIIPPLKNCDVLEMSFNNGRLHLAAP